MKHKMLLILLLSASMNMYSVETNNGHVNFNSRIASSYLYRGMNIGGLSFQPQLDLNYYGLNGKVWYNIGSSNLAFNDYVSELDLQIGYDNFGFNTGLKFIYNIHTPLGHYNKPTIEYYIGYDFLNKYPNDKLKLNVSTYVYGDDYNEYGYQAYSTYIELSYKHVFICNAWTNLNVGFTPWSGMYARKIAFVNLSYSAGYIFDLSYMTISPYAIIMVNPDGINRDNIIVPFNESYLNQKLNIAVGVDFNI